MPGGSSASTPSRTIARDQVIAAAARMMEDQPLLDIEDQIMKDGGRGETAGQLGRIVDMARSGQRDFHHDDGVGNPNKLTVVMGPLDRAIQEQKKQSFRMI